MNDQQLSLFELQHQVKGSLDATFAWPVWVKAEISEMTINRSGHCYLDLVETDSATDQVIARCRATIWSFTFRMLKPYFETTTGQQFTQGLKVLLQAKVEYHEVYGFSLNIRDIDPVFTLGDLARQRREILRRLQEDGILEMNKEIELPLVPQRIAIISSPTAAGLQDFVDQLHNNPHQFVFYSKLFPAVMQGSEAPASIMNALDLIYSYEDWFDAVVIIRGGGAQLDLDCFDHYELASNVAQFPFPVITGIGHDKDDTVIDLVAHTRMKTPTAVAEFLIGGALRFSQELKELEIHFIELVKDQMDEKKRILNEAADSLHHMVQQMIVSQQNRLQVATIQVANHTGKFLKNKQNNLLKLLVEAKNCSNKYVVQQNHWLEQAANKLKFGIRAQIRENENSLQQYRNLLKIQTTELIRNEKKNINIIGDKLRLIDPQNVLKRGYSLTMHNGKLLKSVNMIREGDWLETKLSDGSLKSKVEKASPTPLK